jgi:hypothetical protein
MKLVVLPLKNDFDKDKAFCVNLLAFLFQVALREFFFDFEVRFLGTAIIFFKVLKLLYRNVFKKSNI